MKNIIKTYIFSIIAGIFTFVFFVPLLFDINADSPFALFLANVFILIFYGSYIWLYFVGWIFATIKFVIIFMQMKKGKPPNKHKFYSILLIILCNIVFLVAINNGYLPH